MSLGRYVTQALEKRISFSLLPNIRFFSTQTETVSPSVHITDRCAQVIHKLVNQDWVKNKEEAKLRVEVEPGGCSGFQWRVSLDDSPLSPDDKIFEKNNAKVVVDSESLKHLDGCTVDYKEELIRKAFVVEGIPNATKKCGCGSSFESKVS